MNDRGDSDRPASVFTGDTLFVGDVGRPDLSPSHTPQQLAEMLYRSIHEKLLDSFLTTPKYFPPMGRDRSEAGKWVRKIPPPSARSGYLITPCLHGPLRNSYTI